MPDDAAGPGRVLVVGDLLVDVVARPEGPLRIGSDTAAEVRLAGGGSAANTAAWIAHRGGAASLLAAVGDDPLGVVARRDLAAAGVELAGPEWTLDTIVDGERASSVPEGVTATITFADDDTYAVVAGCNSGNGTYVEGDGTVDIEAPTLTRRRCAEEATSVETAVVAALDGEVALVIDADRLTLTAASGAGLSFTTPA